MIKLIDDDLPKARANIWIYLISIVPATAIALFSSHDVLNQHPLLNQYTSIVGRIIPSISRLAAVSSFPEITRLVLSAEWTLLPVQIVLFLLKRSYIIRVEEWQERKLFKVFCLLIFSSVLLWSAIFLYEVTPEDFKGRMLNEVLLRGLSTSRIGLGIISSIFMSGTALIIGLLLLWARYIPHIYFGYEEGIEQ